MKAGAKLNFGKAEVYWPQDDKASDKFQTLLGIEATPEAQSKELVQPTFDVKVKIDAQVDVLVTPEVSLSLFAFVSNLNFFGSVSALHLSCS